MPAPRYRSALFQLVRVFLYTAACKCSAPVSAQANDTISTISAATKEETPAPLSQARKFASANRAGEAEAAITEYSASLDQTSSDKELITAGELLILAQAARNDARFATAAELSKRALARVEIARRLVSKSDLNRQVGIAEIQDKISELYAPDPDFPTRARKELAEKRAEQALRKAKMEEGK